MRASHELAGVSVSYDEANLVSAAGLLPTAGLAQKLGLAELIEARVRLAEHGANCGTKALSVVGSMLAGGDSIDDIALLRAGAMPELFDRTRAPSTIGTWLRAFKWSNVRELDAVTRGLLARLWAAGAGPADPAGALTIDVDSTICEVYGRDKQGANYGYTKVRGYHPQLATLAETGQVIFSRLRGGSAGAARGAKSFLTETVSRLRDAGASGPLTVRADSAFYSRAMLTTARKFDVRFSVTARQDKRVKAAIEAIPDDAWTPIPYWLSTPEVSGADVAETRYTCFAGTKDAVEVRLVVRRVRPSPGTQLALFTAWDYHAMVTDRAGEMLEVEADHRRHAVVEQSIAELKSAGLAHLPSGKFFANAAWLAFAVIAHNLARGVGALAGTPRTTVATLRRRLFTVPGRLVHSARRLHLRLPTRWPWADQFATALSVINALPNPG
ncbi:MAG TPA: IS1380 family transposase [Acidimicrobiales bacterium]